MNVGKLIAIPIDTSYEYYDVEPKGESTKEPEGRG
jgi:hypothetical protein